MTAQATIRMIRQGVMPYPRGEYSASVADYRWDDDRRDIVRYDGVWYAVKKYAPGTPVPKAQYPSSSSAYWTVTSQFEIVVTSMMIADAIRSEALNVGDMFKVGTDGRVEILNAYVTVTTPSFKILDKNGNPISVFTTREDGTPILKAENIDVDNLYVKKLAATDGTIGAFRLDSAGNVVSYAQVGNDSFFMRGPGKYPGNKPCLRLNIDGSEIRLGKVNISPATDDYIFRIQSALFAYISNLRVSRQEVAKLYFTSRETNTGVPGTWKNLQVNLETGEVRYKD